MKTLLKVEGMSCGHCKAAVTNALQEVEGVTGVDVSLEEKKVTVQHNDSVAIDKLKEAIEDQGYDVVE
ncbi:MAG: copper chaperone CopZ [Bacillaceae bacterium]